MVVPAPAPAPVPASLLGAGLPQPAVVSVAAAGWRPVAERAVQIAQPVHPEMLSAVHSCLGSVEKFAVTHGFDDPEEARKEYALLAEKIALHAQTATPTRPALRPSEVCALYAKTKRRDAITRSIRAGLNAMMVFGLNGALIGTVGLCASLAATAVGGPLIGVVVAVMAATAAAVLLAKPMGRLSHAMVHLESHYLREVRPERTSRQLLQTDGRQRWFNAAAFLAGFGPLYCTPGALQAAFALTMPAANAILGPVSIPAAFLLALGGGVITGGISEAVIGRSAAKFFGLKLEKDEGDTPHKSQHLVFDAQVFDDNVAHARSRSTAGDVVCSTGNYFKYLFKPTARAKDAAVPHGFARRLMEGWSRVPVVAAYKKEKHNSHAKVNTRALRIGPMVSGAAAMLTAIFMPGLAMAVRSMVNAIVLLPLWGHGRGVAARAEHTHAFQAVHGLDERPVHTHGPRAGKLGHHKPPLPSRMLNKVTRPDSGCHHPDM